MAAQAGCILQTMTHVLMYRVGAYLYQTALYVQYCTASGSRNLGTVCKITIQKLYSVKKMIFLHPSPAGMSLTKLSLAGNIEIIPGQGDFVW